MAAHLGSPVVHSVHFYEDDGDLICRLSRVVVSAVQAGNPVLLVMTDDHRRQLQQELNTARPAPAAGQLAIHDAAQALDQFMVNGMPDGRRFRGHIGHLVSGAMQAAQNGGRGLTVFGEMVAVLWAKGNKRAALALEELWNELLESHAFHLHCAYPRRVVKGDSASFTDICVRHSHFSVTGSEEVNLRQLRDAARIA